MKRILFFATMLLLLTIGKITFAQQTVLVSTDGTGWKRIAAILANNGRSFGRITIYTTGGSFAPVASTITWYRDWGTTAGLSIQSDSGSPGAFWTQFRVTEDGTNAYIEGNFSKSVTQLYVLLDEGYSWRAATLYTGTLPAGGGNIMATADLGRLNMGNNFVVSHSGNVGIGTSTPTTKLAVNGNIRAREIKVEIANWPDYVFAKDYALPTLQETENHIKEKGHLPGIPSAAEVQANGVELGEMNKKLLQKIEELTLYLIKIKKESERQNKEIENLKSNQNHKQ